MKSITIRLPDDLMIWLETTAAVARRSKTKQVQFILEQARSDGKKECVLSTSQMCDNGRHRFKSDNPAISEFCNCGMFVYGEVIR